MGCLSGCSETPPVEAEIARDVIGEAIDFRDRIRPVLEGIIAQDSTKPMRELISLLEERLAVTPPTPDMQVLLLDIAAFRMLIDNHFMHKPNTDERPT